MAFFFALQSAMRDQKNTGSFDWTCLWKHWTVFLLGSCDLDGWDLDTNIFVLAPKSVLPFSLLNSLVPV